MINSDSPHKKYLFKNTNIFEKIPDKVYSLLEENKIVVKLKKGQVLFYEGTIPNGVYILKRGRAKKYSKGINDKEYIFHLLKENDILGHHDILCNEAYSHSVACLTDCLFYLIPKNIFLFILKNNPFILDNLLKSISREFGVFVNNSRVLAQHNVRERTALSLIKLNYFFEDDQEIILSRKDHSNIIGTSIESLIRVLHDFKEEGIVEVRESKIIIKDAQKLAEIFNPHCGV